MCLKLICCHEKKYLIMASAVCLLDFGSFISIEVCRDCIPVLASSCKKQLTGFFVCLLFFLKVKRISVVFNLSSQQTVINDKR